MNSDQTVACFKAGTPVSSYGCVCMKSVELTRAIHLKESVVVRVIMSCPFLSHFRYLERISYREE